MKRFKVNKLFVFCENYNREFKTKLALSSMILRETSLDSIYVGDQRSLYFLARFGFINRSVVLLKSAQKYVFGYIQRLKRKNILFLQDEEGLVSLDGKVRNRNDRDNLRLIDEIFCWNEKELNSFLDVDRALAPKLNLTGNLRTSKYTDFQSIYKEEIKKIRKKYARYILVAGNGKVAFSQMHEPPLSEMIDKNAKLNGRDKEHVESVNAWSTNMVFSYFHLFDFIARLQTEDSLQDVSIVYRPHPGENKLLIQKLFEDVKQVFIEDCYSVIPWLLNADIIIGSGSTVLVEARSLGRPTISLVHNLSNPKYSKIVNMLPNRVSYQVSNGAELVDAVKNSSSKIDELLSVDDFCSTEIDTYRHYINRINEYLEVDDMANISFFQSFYDCIYRISLKIYRLVTELKSSENYKVNHNKKFPRAAIKKDMSFIEEFLSGEGLKAELIDERLIKISRKDSL